jgi:hypothetical protein
MSQCRTTSPIFALIFAFSGILYAQSALTIQGHVLSSDGYSPVSGATVTIEATTARS